MGHHVMSVVLLSCNDLRDRLFESYKENLMGFSNQLLNYLYSSAICLCLY